MTGPWIIAFMVLSVMVFFLAILELGLFRRVVSVLEQSEARLRIISSDSMDRGLPAGSLVPDLEAVESTGEPFRPSDLAGEAAIYTLLSADCEPCRLLLDDITRRGLPDKAVRLVAIIADTDEGRALRLPEGVMAVFQKGDRASRAFQTSATPHAFAVDREGVIVGSLIPNTVADLKQLSERLMSEGVRKETQHAAGSSSLG